MKFNAKLRDGVIPRGTTVWKKLPTEKIARYDTGYIAECIALGDGVIPTDARKQVQVKSGKIANSQAVYNRSNGTVLRFRKCRVPAVYVVNVTRDGVSVSGKLESYHTVYGTVSGGRTYYEAGKVVEPDSYNDNPDDVCTNGIHVFLSKNEAEKYNFS